MWSRNPGRGDKCLVRSDCVLMVGNKDIAAAIRAAGRSAESTIVETLLSEKRSVFGALVASSPLRQEDRQLFSRP